MMNKPVQQRNIYIYMCPQNTGGELQALANTLNLACQRRRVTRSPPLLHNVVRAQGGKQQHPAEVDETAGGLCRLFVTQL